MTEQKVEKIVDNHIIEDFDHMLWLLPTAGKKRILGKDSLIYLCKKCYKLGLEYGIQIERERNRKGQIIFGKASSSRRI